MTRAARCAIARCWIADKSSLSVSPWTHGTRNEFDGHGASMAASGHKRTFHLFWPMSALPPKADIWEIALDPRKKTQGEGRLVATIHVNGRSFCL